MATRQGFREDHWQQRGKRSSSHRWLLCTPPVGCDAVCGDLFNKGLENGDVCFSSWMEGEGLEFCCCFYFLFWNDFWLIEKISNYPSPRSPKCEHFFTFLIVLHLPTSSVRHLYLYLYLQLHHILSLSSYTHIHFHGKQLVLIRLFIGWGRMLGSMGNTGGNSWWESWSMNAPPQICFASLFTSVCLSWGELSDLLIAMDFEISQWKHVCFHWKGNTVVICRAERCWFFWRYVKREECRDFVWGFSLISSISWVLHPLRLLWEWREAEHVWNGRVYNAGSPPLHHSQSWLKNHKNKNKVETQWLSEYSSVLSVKLNYF